MSERPLISELGDEEAGKNEEAFQRALRAARERQKDTTTGANGETTMNTGRLEIRTVDVEHGAERAWWTVGGFLVTALLVAAAVMSGCGEMGATAQTADQWAATNATGQSCVPQQAVFCACPGGADGVQVCGSDGTYGACDCSAAIGASPGGSNDMGAPDVGTGPDAPAGPVPWSPTCDGGGGFGDEDFEELMYPGGACISCHRQEQDDDKDDAPIYSAAGTVMLGLHEEDDCAGVPGATVVITGADGTVTRMTTNRVGNFFTNRRIVTPYTAVVEYQGRTLPMVGPQTDLDCNGCHSVAGSQGAPGRVIAP